MGNILVTIEDLAKTALLDVETFADTEYHAFLTATKPLFDDLKTFATATGRADVATLLSDIKAGLVSGIEAAIVSGGNIGTAVAAVAATEIGLVTTEVKQDAVNAVHGALAIVGADIPAIASPPSAIIPPAAPAIPPAAK